MDRDRRGVTVLGDDVVRGTADRVLDDLVPYEAGNAVYTIGSETVPENEPCCGDPKSTTTILSLEPALSFSR